MFSPFLSQQCVCFFLFFLINLFLFGKKDLKCYLIFVIIILASISKLNSSHFNWSRALLIISNFRIISPLFVLWTFDILQKWRVQNRRFLPLFFFVYLKNPSIPALWKRYYRKISTERLVIVKKMRLIGRGYLEMIELCTFFFFFF